LELKSKWPLLISSSIAWAKVKETKRIKKDSEEQAEERRLSRMLT